MVRAMNIRMAIGAAAIEVLDGAERLSLRGVAAGVVAGIADAGHAHFQELWIVATVRFVAVGAVFKHRRMFPQEGTAALGVAAEAVFVGGRLNELGWIGRTVRIVAAGAGNFALAIRHVGRALQLGAAHLMAPQAEFRLFFGQAAVV